MLNNLFDALNNPDTTTKYKIAENLPLTLIKTISDV